MLGADALGRLALAQEPSLSQRFILTADVGTFVLTGGVVNLSFSKITLPMATRRDYWDVDEWGKFIPGGGLRYTI